MISGTAIVLTALFCGGLGFFWIRVIGVTRATLAALCRFLWVLPIVLSLNPEVKTTMLPRALNQQPINILLDDSVSMRSTKLNAKDMRDHIEKLCLQYGCIPKMTKLSELQPLTLKGWSPLSSVLEPWLFKTGSEPWMLLSDGADWRPADAWDTRLAGRGQKIKDRSLGLILGYGEPQKPAFWMQDANIQGFAFEDRSVTVVATVGRVDTDSEVKTQVQVLIDGKAVTANTAYFAKGANEAHAELSFSSPSRGPHLITVKALPMSGEKDIWDNEIHETLEVMPNTIGVLHLLGAPSWDGRFLRRYFKAEPKFDLISFFILRDPWDSQQVSERELSLIPFPVERLFKEELANFKVLVIQNFTMLQFLQQEYQENLVKFVKDGGGLLFIGGPRALTESDMQSSPFAEMMPFSLESSAGRSSQIDNPLDPSQALGSTYDSKRAFDIELAQPDSQQRALANVYDDWESMGTRLTSLKSMHGIHRMDQIKFKNQDMTPLLKARLSGGQSVPLAVASYPGKGRALWLFSDSFWKLAMTDQAGRSRYGYQQFFDAAMTWLMRHERRAPLTAREFSVQSDAEHSKVRWSVRLAGPAAKYIATPGGDWAFNICGRSVAKDLIQSEQISSEVWKLSGELKFIGRGGSICSFAVDWNHPAFGSVKTHSNAVFSDTLEDSSMSPSPRKLRKLADLTGASYVGEDGDRMRALDDWLRSWTGVQDLSLPERHKTIRDFYWVLSRPWIWLLLLLIPLEVVIRRWHLIYGSRID